MNHFIELTLENTKKKCLINVLNTNGILVESGHTIIYMTPNEVYVSESYEEVKELIRKSQSFLGK